MRKIQPDTVWNIQTQQPTEDPFDQKLNGGAIYGISDAEDRVGTLKANQRVSSPPRGGEGATSIQWHPEQSYACQTSSSGELLQLQIPNHGLALNDVISFRSPFLGETHVIAANETGFVVNGYFNEYSSGVTGVTYAVATPQTNPLIINHVDVWGTSANAQQSRLRVLNEDNINSIMWVSGHFIYLGTRFNYFAKPAWGRTIREIESGSNVPWPIHTGYQRTRYYVPEGFDPEATATGAKFTYSDGRKGEKKTTEWYSA